MSRKPPKLPTVKELFGERQRQTESDLLSARSLIRHTTAKGDRSEDIWCNILSAYLPARYDVRSAFVIDSLGNYSEQIDLVVHDRFYTPFVFVFGGYEIIPIEAVYAVFEVKQDLRLQNVRAAQNKVKSVRKLKQCHAPTQQVPNPKKNQILGGLLATQTTTKSLLDEGEVSRFMNSDNDAGLNFICVAQDGLITDLPNEPRLTIIDEAPVAAFPIKLAGAMQWLGTVSPIDLQAYLDG